MEIKSSIYDYDSSLIIFVSDSGFTVEVIQYGWDSKQKLKRRIRVCPAKPVNFHAEISLKQQVR
jgi:hypothetical protein